MLAGQNTSSQPTHASYCNIGKVVDLKQLARAKHCKLSMPHLDGNAWWYKSDVLCTLHTWHFMQGHVHEVQEQFTPSGAITGGPRPGGSPGLPHK